MPTSGIYSDVTLPYLTLLRFLLEMLHRKFNVLVVATAVSCA